MGTDLARDMDNPYEEAQSALLARIVANVTRLNESIGSINDNLGEINKKNCDVEILSLIWDNYQRNAQFHLESTNRMQEPK